MRLDKYLSQAGIGTRSEVKELIRCGRVFLNGEPAKRPEQKVDQTDQVRVDGREAVPVGNRYYMLNKPAGVVSATTDKRDKTVVELLPPDCRRNIFPVGRLDKDTEGLLLLTDDGALAHRLLSPRRHVPKTYFVRIEGQLTQEDIAQMTGGMDIGDEKPTKPALLEEIRQEGCYTECRLTITEGRYHQIKRMFAKIGKPVCYLKRLSMGTLCLDERLQPGEFRALTQEEISGLPGERDS